MEDDSIFNGSIFKSSLLESNFSEIFDDADEMLFAVLGTANFVGNFLGEKRKIKRGDIFLTRLRVVFTSKVKQVEIDTGLLDDVLTIYAPIRSKEKKETKEKRRVELLNNFLQSVQDSKLKTIIFLYTTLSKKTRKELTDRCRKEFKGGEA